MRAVWIDAGQDVNADKLRAHQITAPYFAVSDARITASYLDGVRDSGFAPGLYAAWNWYPELNGPEFAERLHRELLRIRWFGNPPVCVDIETHEVPYIRAFLKRWRELRKSRKTDWTLEAFQGGLFRADDVAAIVQADVGIVPQFYTGDMRPFAADRALLDLLYHGFPFQSVFGFYDAARLPLNWEGYAFTQGRLP